MEIFVDQDRRNGVYARLARAMAPLTLLYYELNPRYEPKIRARADLLEGLARGGLARTPARSDAPPGPQMIGRQLDVPSIGKFEIARNNSSGAALDDKSRAVGELAWKAAHLAHDLLADASLEQMQLSLEFRRRAAVPIYRDRDRRFL